MEVSKDANIFPGSHLTLPDDTRDPNIIYFPSTRYGLYLAKLAVEIR